MLVLSITNIVVQLQLVNIRQYNMVLNSPRITTTVLAYYLFMQSSILGNLLSGILPPKPHF